MNPKATDDILINGLNQACKNLLRCVIYDVAKKVNSPIKTIPENELNELTNDFVKKLTDKVNKEDER